MLKSIRKSGDTYKKKSEDVNVAVMTETARQECTVRRNCKKMRSEACEMDKGDRYL